MMTDISPLWISLRVALTATAVTFILGVAAARAVLYLKRLKVVFDAIFSIPMVLPPTVMGFLLLVLLGKNSILGEFLYKIGYEILFTTRAAVIAAITVTFPIMYRTVRGAFEQVDSNLIYAARTLGMSELEIFFKILIPISRPSIIAALILSFARAMGDFGTTIMLAGNIPGKTQTMSIAVYSAVQGGNRALAYVWVSIMIFISFLTIFLMNLMENLNKK